MRDEVTLAMIGCGGIDGDVPLVQQIEEWIQRLSVLVHDADRGGEGAKGTISVKIVITAGEDRDVLIAASVSGKEPPRIVRVLKAELLGDGQVLASAHRQEALDLSTRD